MPALSKLMKRLGFVKLSRYGLVLTPEGRIMSLRPAVLDDGLGGKVVGWEDGDLAAMELQPWEPARPAPQRAVAIPVAMRPPAVPAMPAKRRATTQHPVVVIPPLPAPAAPVSVPLPPVAAAVASAPEPEEDDWEWTIALARARAAAEEVELAARQAAVRAPRRTRPTTVPPPPPIRPSERTVPEAPKFVSSKTIPMATIANAPRTQPMPAVDPTTSGAWPATPMLDATIDYDKPASAERVVRLVPPAPPQAPPRPPRPTQPTTLAGPGRTMPRAPSPATVIPIPKLPTMRTAPNTRIEPVVASSASGSRPRFAKGTTQPRMAAMPPPIRPAEEDRTKPGVELPRPANVIALHAKKRLATGG